MREERNLYPLLHTTQRGGIKISNKSIIYSYTPQELQYLLDTSNSYSDVLRKINLRPKGGNSKTLKKVIQEYNLDETRMNINRSNLYKNCAFATHNKTTIPIEDIFDGKYPNYQAAKLLKRLVNEGYKEYKCEQCGIDQWLGNPISLQLHHMDGDHTNNRLNNLQILCPNCHTQTDNYAGKKK